MKLVKLGMVCGALLLAACGGEDGATGATGPAGAPGPAGPAGSSGGAAAVETINGITPARAFPARTVQMTISGDNTNWTTAPAVTFDDAAITTSDIQVASPTALVLTVEIGAESTLGPKTITVGGQTYKGFQVSAAAEALIVGTPLQGGFVAVDVKNNDRQNFFDTTTDADGRFIGVAIGVGGDGANIGGIQSVSVTSASGLLLFDVDAPSGERSIFVENVADELSFVTDSKLTVAARAPEALTVDGDTTGTQTALGTKLYQLTLPAAPTNGARISLTVDGGGTLFGLPGGKWTSAAQNVISVGVNPGATTSQFLVLGDLSGAGAGAFSITASEAVDYDGKEAEPNETAATANALPLATTHFATLSADTDADWFSFTTTATNAIHVVTDSPNKTVQSSYFGDVVIAADTAVAVYGALDLTTPLFTSDAGYGEDVFSATVLPAGNYVVKVTVNPTYFNAANTEYSIAVTSEALPPPEPE